MSEKEEVVFDADVYRRLEFLERRFNEIVDETHDTRAVSEAFAGISLCVAIMIVVLAIVFPFVVIR